MFKNLFMFFLFESILVIEALGFGDVKCAVATRAYSRRWRPSSNSYK